MDESSDKPVEMEVEKAMEGTDPKIDEFPEADSGIPTEPTKFDCFVCEYDHEEGNCPVRNWTTEQLMSGYHDLKPKRPEPAFRCAVCGSDPEKDGKCSHVSWIPNWVHQESGPSGLYRNKRCTHCHQFGHWEKKCPEKDPFKKEKALAQKVIRQHFQRPRVKTDAEQVPEGSGGVNHDAEQFREDPAVLKWNEMLKAVPRVPKCLPSLSQLKITTQPPANFRCNVCEIVPKEEGECPHVSRCGVQYCDHCSWFGHISRNCPRKTPFKGPGGLGSVGDKQQVPLFGNYGKRVLEGPAGDKQQVPLLGNYAIPALEVPAGDKQQISVFQKYGKRVLEGPDAGTEECVHIRMQLQQGSKSLTTVQGLKKNSWYNNIIKDLEKFCRCNGTVIVQDPQRGQVIQLDGDQRKNVSTFLVQAGLVEKEYIKIHGF